MLETIASFLPVVWLAAIIVFAIAEAASAGTLISIWFSVGSLAALIVSFCTKNFWIQLVVFFVVSIAVLALVRPLTKKYFTPKLERTNAEALVGQEAVVTETVDNLAATGLVQLRGQTWTARSVDSAPLTPGTRVTVVRLEGVKVIVKAAE